MLLIVLALLARFDQWLKDSISVPYLTFVFFGLVVYIEARWISSFLKLRFLPLLGLAVLAELTSMLASMLVPYSQGTPFIWILSDLAYFDQSLYDSRAIVFWDSTTEFLLQLLGCTVYTVVLATLFESIVYGLGLRKAKRSYWLWPAILTVNLVSYPGLAFLTLAVIFLFRVI